eukprot:Phypoly_transcript_09475.p1 GENE.Phypoly_transcript_09475~~Phypoly_transcript_09475.p1  ORF type:complete len:279 (+),score=28.30 Phypoly_transcript_09475:471-1307(+)
MEMLSKRGLSFLQKLKISGGYNPFDQYVSPKDATEFKNLKCLAVHNLNTRIIESFGVLPSLTKLEVKDTIGYFEMRKSYVNANYSKVSHTPICLSTIYRLSPNLQELDCDFLRVPEEAQIVFPHVKKLSLVACVTTIRIGQLGGEDWSEDRKIEKLSTFFPNLEILEIRDPLLCPLHSSQRHSSLLSWFFVEDRQIKSIMQAWRKTLTELRIEKAKFSINFLQSLKSIYPPVLLVVGPQSVWPSRTSSMTGNSPITRASQKWRSFSQLDGSTVRMGLK